MTFPLVRLTPTASRQMRRKPWISYESITNTVKFYDGEKKWNPDGTYSIFMNVKKNGGTVTVHIKVSEEDNGPLKTLVVKMLHTTNATNPTT